MLNIEPFTQFRISADISLSSRSALTAPVGTVTVISGESGSGKSVLLEMLAGYRPLSDGRQAVAATVLAADGSQVTPLDAFLAQPTRMAYLPQQSILRSDATPRQALDDWQRILLASYPADHLLRAQVAEIREELGSRLFSVQEQRQIFGLDLTGQDGGMDASAAKSDGAKPRVEPRIRQLSGGQQRRLDVLMCLCSPAELILLDEPDAGLDAARRRVLFETLTAHAARYGKIVLMVSHYAVAEGPIADLHAWRIQCTPETNLVRADDQAARAAVDMTLHEPPRDKFDRRLDQLGLYTRRRLLLFFQGWGKVYLIAPLLFLALVRLAIYPVREPRAMALLFFFALTCFWLGAVQATAFWTDERILFYREGRQGASSFAYMGGFLVALAIQLTLQSGLAAAVVKYLHWQDLLRLRLKPLHPLSLSYGALLFWGAWAGMNGMLTGLFWSTVQHRLQPRLTGPVTAQLIALTITLMAIVFSFPIIGADSYGEPIPAHDVHGPDRMRILHTALCNAYRPEYPFLAIALAECPMHAASSFHGLWFQGEKPLTYDKQMLERPEKIAAVKGFCMNFSILAISVALLFGLARSILNKAVMR